MSEITRYEAATITLLVILCTGGESIVNMIARGMGW